MNVVDSSGWLEYFAKGYNSDFFAPIIQDIESVIVPTISIYEVYKKIAQQCSEEKILNVIGWMSSGIVVDLTKEIALTAAELSLEHEMPMADSIIFATAQIMNATLWTQDEHFIGMEGVKYIVKN